MQELNQKLRSYRKSKQLSIAYIASRLGLSESVIESLENNDLTKELYPIHAKLSYISQYAEFLGMPEEETNRILNHLNTENKKQQRKAHLGFFDYFNRLAIIILIGLLLFNVYDLYIKSKQTATADKEQEAIIIQSNDNQLPTYDDFDEIQKTDSQSQQTQTENRPFNGKNETQAQTAAAEKNTNANQKADENNALNFDPASNVLPKNTR